LVGVRLGHGPLRVQDQAEDLLVLQLFLGAEAGGGTGVEGADGVRDELGLAVAFGAEDDCVYDQGDALVGAGRGQPGEAPKPRDGFLLEQDAARHGQKRSTWRAPISSGVTTGTLSRGPDGLWLVQRRRARQAASAAHRAMRSATSGASSPSSHRSGR